MKITHILLYKFREDVPDSKIDDHIEFIKSFEGVAEGLLDLKVGRNVFEWDKKFSHGFVMRFDSEESLEKYGNSDKHQELLDRFKPLVENKVVFDIHE